MTKEVTPAGWHPDPGDPAFLRWWDGATWTDERRPRTPQELDQSESDEEGSGLTIVGILLAIFIPFIGFLMGLAMIAGRRRNGGWVMFLSVVVFLLWIIVVAGR